MAGEKRAFPYYSSVPDINLKRRGVGDVNPGREKETAELFELPDLEPSEAVSLIAQTSQEESAHLLGLTCDPQNDLSAACFD